MFRNNKDLNVHMLVLLAASEHKENENFDTLTSHVNKRKILSTGFFFFKEVRIRVIS